MDDAVLLLCDVDLLCVISKRYFQDCSADRTVICGLGLAEFASYISLQITIALTLVAMLHCG